MPNQIKISRYWENTFFVIYNLVTLDGGDTWFSLASFWYILYSLWKYVYFFILSTCNIKIFKITHIFCRLQFAMKLSCEYFCVFLFFVFATGNIFLWNTGICQERERQMTLGWRLWWCWLVSEWWWLSNCCWKMQQENFV